jgi:cysteinyl-tRNA synthetase
MRLYNTLTNEKAELSPDTERDYRMFVCGPTVQDNVHLGHAKTYFAFDILARWLLRKGIKVYFLMNITDVDDKIFDRAKKESVPYMQIADRFFSDFVEDLEALNIVTVSKFARVSKYVHESASLVLELVEAGKAYPVAGNVYFDTSKADHFGKLSHQGEFELRMKIIDAGPGKKNSTDFLLWRSVPDATEGIWETPVGKGRPGWHIQDSAIVFEEFEGPYDLHGGATELIFPHHESELAQDEAISGKIPFVGIWMHTGLLLKDGEKMSKSLGNVMTIREALRNCDADLLRAFFLLAIPSLILRR